MQFTCDQDTLKTILDIVSMRASYNISYLGYIWMSFQKGILQVYATDLEAGIWGQIWGQGDLTGTAVIPARIISDLVALLPSGPVVLEIDGTALVLSAGKNRMRIEGIQESQYTFVPTINKNDLENGLSLDVEQLKSAIDKVAFAALRDKSHPVLQGVCLDIDQEGITFTATDQFRLATHHISGPGVDSPVKAIIHRRVMSDLARICSRAMHSEPRSPVFFEITEKQALFMFGFGDPPVNVVLISQLVAGPFVKWRDLIPPGWPISVQVPGGALLSACEVARVFGGDEGVLRFRINPSGSIVVSASSASGEGTTEIEASVEGGEIDIAFSASLIFLPIKHSGDLVAIGFTAPNGPAIIYPAVSDGKTRTIFLVMPIVEQ